MGPDGEQSPASFLFFSMPSFHEMHETWLLLILASIACLHINLSLRRISF